MERETARVKPVTTTRRKLSTTALAAGVAASLSAGAVAATPADAGVYWYASACCQNRHRDSVNNALFWEENYKTSARLTNWYHGRHNAGIWECAQGKLSNRFISYTCASAYNAAVQPFSPNPPAPGIDAYCWTGSNNVGGTTSHFMKCVDSHGSF